MHFWKVLKYQRDEFWGHQPCVSVHETILVGTLCVLFIFLKSEHMKSHLYKWYADVQGKGSSFGSWEGTHVPYGWMVNNLQYLRLRNPSTIGRYVRMYLHPSTIRAWQTQSQGESNTQLHLFDTFAWLDAPNTLLRIFDGHTNWV